jgi:hypothetical protein
MKTQFPKQLNELKTLLDSFSERELSCDQLNFTLHDEEEHVPVNHFFPDPENVKLEFICWGEKVADNLILSWLVDGKTIENAPIAMIDSEQSPVAVVANSPEDFLKILPYGTSMIGSIAENCLKNWAEQEYSDTYFEEYLNNEIKKASNENDFALNEHLEIAKMYGDTFTLERPKEELRAELEQQGKAYLELINWYKTNGIEIAKNPFTIIKEAVTSYPNFFDRAIELGLPFQKWD